MGANSAARALPALCVIGFVVAGCAGAPPQYADTHHGKYRAGRPNYTVAPYQINGVWYYPKVDYAYDESGTASWYGEQFNHRPTSDGEIFDMNELSAAHKTLPLPSVVAVTNVQNGREVRLRVNDRGPFVGDRLIDVSRRAAQLLGFERSGMAPVRVRVLKDESIQVAAAAMRGEYGPVGVADSAQARRTEVAAAIPPSPPQRRAPLPAPVAEMAAAAPSADYSPPPVAALAPPPVATLAEREPAVAPPRELPPPLRQAYAANSRSYWPSLIAPAHAEAMHDAAPVHRSAVAATKSSARIFIQAGAFAVPENAQRVRSRIAGLGNVEVVTMEAHGAPLYRVRLGPVASETEAARLLDKVVDRGYSGARVVSE
jgi:rare lipoprotein A